MQKEVIMSLRKFKQYIYLMEVDTNENGKMDLTFLYLLFSKLKTSPKIILLTFFSTNVT